MQLVEEPYDLQPPPKERYPVRPLRALGELARSRELVRTLVERDFRVRYKQTVLGAFWAILQPLILLGLFSIVFGRIAKVGSEGAPYAVFGYSALVPWGYFSATLSRAPLSVVSNATIVRKIYLPREIFPLATILTSLIDFAMSFLILLVFLFAFGYFPTMSWISLPLLLLVLIVLSAGATMVFAAATVYFRDINYAITTFVQILLYATPVAYPVAKVQQALPGTWGRLYAYVNPLVPPIDGFRRVLIHGQWPAWKPLGVAAATGIVLWVLIYRWYKRIDPNFADVI